LPKYLPGYIGYYIKGVPFRQVQLTFVLFGDKDHWNLVGMVKINTNLKNYKTISYINDNEKNNMNVFEVGIHFVLICRKMTYFVV
jgi:hypothetical protein